MADIDLNKVIIQCFAFGYKLAKQRELPKQGVLLYNIGQ
jgi:hypothetical protein